MNLYVMQSLVAVTGKDLRKQAVAARRVKLSRRARRDGVTRLSEL
jgi:hypothetical protein